MPSTLRQLPSVCLQPGLSPGLRTTVLACPRASLAAPSIGPCAEPALSSAPTAPATPPLAPARPSRPASSVRLPGQDPRAVFVGSPSRPHIRQKRMELERSEANPELSCFSPPPHSCPAATQCHLTPACSSGFRAGPHAHAPAPSLCSTPRPEGPPSEGSLRCTKPRHSPPLTQEGSRRVSPPTSDSQPRAHDLSPVVLPSSSHTPTRCPLFHRLSVP